MPIPSENISYLIKKVKPLLNECEIPYWLGRGVLRNFYINKKIGDQQSDLDFHVWIEDSHILKQVLIPIFKKENFSVDDKEYKLAFYRPHGNHEFFIEFMYLFREEENPEIVYHARAGTNKRYCPKACFSSEVELINIGDIGIRIPNFVEQYLRGIYGKNWDKNSKGDKEATSSPEMFEGFIASLKNPPKAVGKIVKF